MLRLTAADLAPFEENHDSIDLLLLAGDFAGLQVHALRDRTSADINHGVVTAFRENVDQHLQRKRIIQQRILGTDGCATGDGMPHDNRNQLGFDQRNDLVKQFAVVKFILIESFDQITSGMLDDMSGQRNIADRMKTYADRAQVNSGIPVREEYSPERQPGPPVH